MRARLAALISELRRRRVLNVAIAYAVVGWLIIQVAATTFPLLGLPAGAATLVLAIVLLGFPVVLVMAWVFDLTPAGLKRTPSAEALPVSGAAGSAPVTLPAIRYTSSDGVSIAYYTYGAGPVDLVLVQGWISHLEYAWESPAWRDFIRGLASFARVITFDKRGTGLSDRTAGLPTLEQRMDDVRAVMDAVGSERALVFGYSEGGPMAMLFAATYPERTLGLVLYGTYVKRTWSPDYPWAPTPEERQRFYDTIQQHWGEAENDIEWLAPSMIGDDEFLAWWSAYQRRSASPGAALALARMNTEVDARHVLPGICVPTLVMHREHDADARVEEGRYIAGQIPGARLLVLPGGDHAPFVKSEEIVRHIRHFVTGLVPVKADRVLATILHVEPVVSDALRSFIRSEILRYHGRELRGAGPACQAAFDGPARAVRGALAIRARAVELAEVVSIGLHTGECERGDEGLTGLPTRIAAAVAAQGGAGQVAVTSTVKDIVAGSGLEFATAGRMDVPGAGDWQLYRVAT
jgi:pimeloyl-ACP methyl ester carboxylesterase